MAGGLQNEPTTSSQISMARERFERDVVRGNVPPYYLVPERIKEGYKVLGGAPGTRETDLLEPEKLVEKISKNLNFIFNFTF